jgi:hypothetical protein
MKIHCAPGAKKRRREPGKRGDFVALKLRKLELLEPSSAGMLFFYK